MFKLKKLVVLLVILLLLVGIAVQVQASDIIDLGNFLTNTSTNTSTTENTTLNITTNTTTNTTSNSIVQPNTNTTNTAGSSENNLPQTGVTEDITVMFFIVVCAIAAIYAYKKIRDYKA